MTPPIYLMFAYGMNTNIINMKLRCRNPKLVGKAYLPEWRLDFRYHLDITQDKKSIVEGVLWELEEDDFALIDQAEGYPDYYNRFIFNTNTGGYKDIQWQWAWAYAMCDKSALQEPDERYWKLVLDGYKQNGINEDQLHDALERTYDKEKSVNG